MLRSQSTFASRFIGSSLAAPLASSLLHLASVHTASSLFFLLSSPSLHSKARELVHKNFISSLWSLNFYSFSLLLLLLSRFKEPTAHTHSIQTASHFYYPNSTSKDDNCFTVPIVVKVALLLFFAHSSDCDCFAQSGSKIKVKSDRARVSILLSSILQQQQQQHWQLHRRHHQRLALVNKKNSVHLCFLKENK